MKRVLIPIDFSDDALNALVYGIAIANQINAKLRIMHVKTGLSYAPNFAKDQVEYKINDKIEVWLKEVIRKYENEYVVPGGEFDYKIREGNVVHEISNQAKYDDSSMIVVGSHGASGFQSRWIGSNAYSLVVHSPCPVLVVNHAIRWKGRIRKMVVPIDFSKASRKKIPIVAGVASAFESKIYLLGLRDSKLQNLLKRSKMHINQAERYLVNKAGLKVESDILIGSNLVQKVIEFAEEREADIITVHVNHSHNPFSTLFKPFANDLINNSTRPVFVVPTYE